MRSSHKEIIAYDEMNCKTEKYRALESQGVNWDGTTTADIHKTDAVDATFDDTADDLVLQNIARKRQRPPRASGALHSL